MTDNQRGVALIGVLGVMVIVALITLSALERSILQTRNVTAALDRSRALEAAEFALQRAEGHAPQWSRAPVSPPPPPRRDAWRSVIRAHGQAVSGAPNEALLGRAPKVLVEQLRPIGSTQCPSRGCDYRLSALAGKRGDGADIVLQVRINSSSTMRIWRMLR